MKTFEGGSVVLDLWERWIQFYELRMDIEPEHAPNIPLKQIVPLLQQRIDDGEAVKLVQKNTAAIRLAAYKHFPVENVIVLLIQYADKNVTDPTFMHLEKGELRTEPKLDGEGIAVSAHVAISLEPHDDGVGMLYRFLLEEIPGLGRSRISPFIKSELKMAAKGHFEFEDLTDNDKTKSRRPAAEILGTPLRELSEEFSKGTVLQGIELVNLKPNTKEFDEAGYYSEDSRVIRLVPCPNTSLKDIYKKLRPKAKKAGFGNIRVRYKKPAGKQKTVTLGTTKQDIMDSLVVRDEMIRSDEVLVQCSETISESIAQKMVGLVKGAKDNGKKS